MVEDTYSIVDAGSKCYNRKIFIQISSMEGQSNYQRLEQSSSLPIPISSEPESQVLSNQEKRVFFSPIGDAAKNSL